MRVAGGSSGKEVVEADAWRAPWVAQDVQQAQGFVLGRLQEQAMQMGADATAMPARVAKLDRCGSGVLASVVSLASPCLSPLPSSCSAEG